MDGGPGGLQSMGSLESDTTERLHVLFSLSCIGEGNGNPLQCSCLENPRDGEAWWAPVYGLTDTTERTWQQQQHCIPEMSNQSAFEDGVIETVRVLDLSSNEGDRDSSSNIPSLLANPITNPQKVP